GLATPCRAQPSLMRKEQIKSSPSRALPGRAAPSRALPCHAWPRLTLSSCQAGPGRKAQPSPAAHRSVPLFDAEFPKHSAKSAEPNRAPALFDEIENVLLLDFFVREYVEREAQAPTERYDRPRLRIRNSFVEPRHAIVNVAAAQWISVAFEFPEHDRLAV